MSGRHESLGADALFAGDDEVCALCRQTDWSATPLGPPEGWPSGLRAAVRLALDSRTAMAIWGGADFTLIHNQAYAQVLGAKYPAALGRPMREVWPEVWDTFGPLFRQILVDGSARREEEAPIRFRRYGQEEVAYFTHSASAIREDGGRIVGVLHVLEETTQSVRARAEREAFFAFSLDTARIGAWNLDLEDHSATRSAEHDRIFGYQQPLPRWTYEMFLEHVLPEDRPRVDQSFQRAIASGGDWSFECRIHRRDGALRWIWAAGRARVDEQGHRRMAGIVQDISDRKEAEARVQANFERRTFFLKVADALRPLASPTEIQAVAARLLAEQLGLERVYFSEFDWTREVAVVRAEHQRGQGPSVVGEYPLPDHPEIIGALKRGEPIFVGDVRSSPAMSDEARAIAQRLGVVSFGAVPRLRNDRLLYALNVSGHAPRAWTPDEMSLIAEIADRTWAKFERARAEEAMRESENRSRRQLAELQSIYDSAHIGLCVLDRELRFVRINKRLAEINGLPVADHLGRRIDEVLPSVAPTVRGWAERIFRTGVGLVDIELTASTLSQPGVQRSFIEQWLPLKDAGGEVTGINVVVEEVTERRHAMEELRQSLEQLRIAKSAADLAIHDYDVRSGRISWDQRMRALWGVGPEVEITFPLILAGVHPEDRPRVQAAIDRALDPARGGEYRAEFRVISRADGNLRWVSATGHVTFAGGQPVRMVGTAQDISARKAIENALREVDRRKNQFLAVLSHELRNPITPIRNSLYILGRAAPGSAQSARALEVITRQTDQLARLVDDLLDVTRIESNKVQLQRHLLELNELVRHTVEDHRAIFEKRQIALEEEPWPRPVYVDGDWNRLAQAIGNLLQNAAKFTPAGGKTRVVVEADEGAHRAVVRVADTGVGMTAQMVARVFEPFAQADETLDRSRGGLGLGLALVKGLVELHGGEVSATSAGPGRGAQFELRLPLEAPEAARERAAQAPPAHSRRRVLIIEDNADVADSLCEVLTLSDHEVEVAYSGPEGIDRARSFHPDVVLCDIGLPGMSGYEVARAIRADRELKDAFLVALSGYAQPEDLRRAADAGFQRHLAKPPSLDKLERLLAEVH